MSTWVVATATPHATAAERARVSRVHAAVWTRGTEARAYITCRGVLRARRGWGRPFDLTGVCFTRFHQEQHPCMLRSQHARRNGIMGHPSARVRRIRFVPTNEDPGGARTRLQGRSSIRERGPPVVAVGRYHIMP